ncbi:MAG: hypothetical protein U0745_20020 [Polyangia bacterium]
MGMSLVTQLAPSRLASRLVGLWLASVAIGNALAGAFGLLWSRCAASWGRVCSG